MRNLTKPLRGLRPWEGTRWSAALPWATTLLGHALFLSAVYAILYGAGVLTHAPNAKNLMVWDATLFDSVRQAGYMVDNTGYSNTPFFPFFPYLWGWLNLDGLGMSCANFGFMLLGMGLLGRTFEMRRHQVLLLLSVPTVFFCLVPYAEALFFVWSVLLLRGLHRQQVGVTVLGLLGCCLTRSAASLFLPAYVMTEVLACTARADLPRMLGRLAIGLLAMAATLGAVMYLHYLATGNPFAYLESYKYWGHTFQWPLPTRLHDTAGLTVLWLDLLAMLTGLLALAGCVWLSIRWLRGWRHPGAGSLMPSRAVLFAAGYCAAAACFILFYLGGDVAGTSRYILATPFFGVVLLAVPRWGTLSLRARWAVAALAVAVALGLMAWLGWPARFPGFFPAEAHVFFAFWAVYVLLHPLAALGQWRYGRELRAGLYVANVVYQAFLLNTFISQVWLG